FPVLASLTRARHLPPRSSYTNTLHIGASPVEAPPSASIPLSETAASGETAWSGVRQESTSARAIQMNRRMEAMVFSPFFGEKPAVRRSQTFAPMPEQVTLQGSLLPFPGATIQPSPASAQ